jgi:plasmid maintenance system antidote protein VapI
MAFGKNLQNYMKENNLEIGDVVKLTGVPYTTIYSIIERDSDNVAVTVAIRISKGLGISIDDIQNWTNAHAIPRDEQEATAMLEKERRDLLADIRLLSPEDAEQVKGLIQHLAQRGRDRVDRKR